MTPSTTERTDAAIESVRVAQEHHLRAVLTSLCADKRTRDKIIKHLEALSKHDKAPSAEEGKSRENMWICVQCETLFSEDNNKADSCLYHPGKTTAVLECAWSNAKGLDEDEDMMEEFPDGYQWTCCYGQYDAPPCQVGTHTENPSKKGNDKPVSQQKRQRDELQNEPRKERKI